MGLNTRSSSVLKLDDLRTAHTADCMVRNAQQGREHTARAVPVGRITQSSTTLARHVKFAVQDEVHVVERLPHAAIVGDVRDPEHDPNYCQLGMARASHLAKLGGKHERDRIVRLLLGWRMACRESRDAR